MELIAGAVNYIYEASEDDTYRYALGKEATGKKPLLWLCVNPSTAKLVQSANPPYIEYDRTVTRIENISKLHGYDSWVMLNIYSQRATEPVKLVTDGNEVGKAHEKNIETIKAIITDNSTVVAAWGGGAIAERAYLGRYLQSIATKIQQRKIQWCCLGDLTKEGHPRHPSRVAANTGLADFDFADYIKTVRKWERKYTEKNYALTLIL
ncbi:MAG: hypothetical protein Pg6C_07230 [Treponemataceae bacterium]|nr:MAG: hypothetical protein Pg6C_07230 [Treponemataceae bacterium]